MIQQEPTEWQSDAGMSYRIEASDLFATRLTGDIGAEFVWLHREFHRLSTVDRPLFWLSDISQVTGIDREARKIASFWLAKMSTLGLASFGGALTQLVLRTLVLKGVELLHSESKVPLNVYFATEAEARAWIEERRQVLSRQSSSLM